MDEESLNREKSLDDARSDLQKQSAGCKCGKVSIREMTDQERSFKERLMRAVLPQNNVDKAVIFLNSLLEIDREAISELMQHRVTCNKGMADHTDVIVSLSPAKLWVLSPLGLLNGLLSETFEKDGKTYARRIAIELTDDDSIISFKAVDCEV